MNEVYPITQKFKQIVEENTIFKTMTDKSKEIKQSKNKEKTVLYSEIYLKEQIYRCEVRLIKQDRLFITSKSLESSIIDNELLKFYSKNSFNVNSVNIKKIFKIIF